MGELLGEQLQPRVIARFCYMAGWHDVFNLTTAVLVCLSESQGYTRAINENKDRKTGKLLSVDRGIFQLNNVYEPRVTEKQAYDPKEAAKAAYRVYVERGHSFRGWNAHRVLYDIKDPSGRAVKMPAYLQDTYVKRASRGVGNFLAEYYATEAKKYGYQTAMPLPLLDYRA